MAAKRGIGTPKGLGPAFPFEEDGTVQIERMHATLLPTGNFLLENSPFHVFGISYQDGFSARVVDGLLTFDRIVSRGGHSTYRVRLPADKDHPHFLHNWNELEGAGCSFEWSSANDKLLYAIDMPPGVDVRAVYRILEGKEEQGIWEFEEAHYYDPSTR